MLELIREKMKGVFATVIVGFFCAVFALWGVESLFERSGQAQPVATVNGEEITEPEIAQTTKVMRQRYIQMLGGKVDPAFLNDQMLREPALDSIISRKLLQGQADSMNMTVGPETLDREIVQDPTFREDGKGFSVDYYKEKLRSFGITPTMYRVQLQEQMALDQLQQGIAGTAFVTSAQVDSAAALAGQTRSFDYIQLPVQNVMDGINPDDQAIEQYYKDHSNEFMTEEKVSIEYLDLNKNDLQKSIQLEEQDIRASYDQEAASFKPSTERRAAHILIETRPDGSEKTQIEKIRMQVNKDNFASLAKQYSNDKESAAQGGDVGFTKGETFVPEFEAALASLAAPGDISEPVKTEFGYHIIQLLEKRDTAFPSYEERKADIEKQLKQAKASAIYAEKLDQLAESTYSAGDLAGPASELGMSVQKTTAFGRRGGAGIAGQQKVIDAAFSSDLIDSGKNSQAIELSADRAVVLRVNNHEISRPRELVDAKSEIVGKIKKEQAATVIRDKAEAIKKKVQSGVALKSIADEEKLALVSVKAKSRTAKDVDAELLATSFKLGMPANNSISVDSVLLAKGDYAILQLAEVNDVQLDKSGEEYKAVQQKLDTSTGNVEFSLYEQQLRQSAKIVLQKNNADSAEAKN